jgi:hypothetical protein
VEGRVKGKWQLLCEGESVGHKRIEQFDETECTALRLVVEKSTAEPDIKLFSAYSTFPQY